MTTHLDAPLLEHTAGIVPRPLPSAIAQAREDVLAVAADLLAMPETALVRPWAWTGGSEEEVRYGAYRAAELFERAQVDATAAVASTGVLIEDRAASIVGPGTAARWDLHGLVLPLPEALLDADPGGGEWTIRQTLGHVVGGQRAYGWGSAWWVAHRYPLDETLPAAIPGAYWEALPDELTDECEGDLAAIRERLDAILDLSAERLAGLPEELLHVGSRWSGFAVPVGFRLGRWSSHIREHVIQVEKTLDMLGHRPTEPARLVRHVLGAYGRAEAVVFGRRADVASGAAAILAQAAGEAREELASARAAAG